MLIICGSILLSLLIQNKRRLIGSQYRLLIQLSSAFIIWTLISFFFSKSNLLESSFGVTGRQTGVLTYLALTVLMISAVFSGGIKLSNSLLIVLLIAGYIDAGYGLIYTGQSLVFLVIQTFILHLWELPRPQQLLPY